MAQHPSRSMLRRLLARLRQRTPTAGDDLRKCPLCCQPFVCPMDWHEEGDSHWWILLRCGNCECNREVIVANDAAATLDCDLARDERAIACVLERLDGERMRAQVDAFTTALACDLIDASDFAR